MRSSFVRTASAISLSLATLSAQDPALTWRGEPLEVAALASAVPSAEASIRAWLPFAAEHGYRLVLADDARTVLVLSPTCARKNIKKEHREVDVMLGLLRESAAVADRFLAPWAEGEAPAVIVCVRTEHYRPLLAHVASLDPRLKEWSESAGRAVAGFILSEPFVGAWIEDPTGVEEWYPYNELVHRATQLQLRGRAGELPAWLLLGLAWHVEDTVCKSVYCFPYRNGFVSVGAHTDWGLWLANEFKKGRREKGGKPALLSIDEFATWRPGSVAGEFEESKAYLSFGVARFLADEHPEKFREVLAAFDAAIEKGRVTWISANEWTTNPDFQLTSDEQLATLQGLGDDVLDRATEFFRGKKANERKVAKAGR